MPLKLNSSGGGSVTLDVPSTGSTYTVTVPAATGDLVLANAMPAGSVIQAVTNSTVGGSNTTSTTFVDATSYTLTITPSSATNKILIIVSGYALNSLVASTNAQYLQRLLRGATELTTATLSAESSAGGLQAKGTLAFVYLDSPATTSATTYKIQHRVTTASSTGTASNGWIVALEVVA